LEEEREKKLDIMLANMSERQRKTFFRNYFKQREDGSDSHSHDEDKESVEDLIEDEKLKDGNNIDEENENSEDINYFDDGENKDDDNKEDKVKENSQVVQDGNGTSEDKKKKRRK